MEKTEDFLIAAETVFCCPPGEMETCCPDWMKPLCCGPSESESRK